MPCININLPEVKELSDKLQAPVGLVATAIGMWQDSNNNYDRFPNYEEVKQYLYKDNKLLNNNTTTSNKETILNIEDRLKNFFKLFGFQYKEGDLPTDLLSKIIYVNKNDNDLFINNSVKALSQLLLANSNIDFNKLETLIEETPEFKNLFNNSSEYLKNTYNFLKDGNRIPMEEWVSYIKEYNKIKNTVLEKYLKESLLNNDNSTNLHKLINDFIKWFKNLFINSKNLKEVTDNLIKQVLLNQKEVIINSKDLQNKEKVTLAKALEETTHGKDIIKTFGEFGLILTGSISAAEQGSVFRKVGKLLHDIDWVVPKGFTKDFNKKLKDTFTGATLVREFDSPTYYTQTYIVPPKGYTISNLTFFKPEVYGERKYIASYDVLDKNGNVVSNYRRYYDVRESGKVVENREVYNEGLQNVDKNLEAVSVDFFQNKEELKFTPYTVNVEGIKLQLSNWMSSFTEKLKYGRAKDLLDYANFIPNDIINNFNIKEGISELFESNPELANQVYEALGYSEKKDYKKQKQFNYKDVKSKYNFESVNSLLTSIYNNTENPNFKRLSNTFSKIKDLEKVKLIENNNLSVNGTYSLSTNTVTINIDRILKRSDIKGYDAEFMLQQTILHEIVHALTKKATATSEKNEFIRNIENLAYKLYNKEINDSKSDFNKYLEIQNEIKSNRENVSKEDYEFVADRQFKFYGLTSLDEFLTMSMTNPEFRNKLKQTNLWEQFKYVISKFLGIVKTDLDFLENNFDKFLQSTYGINLESQITPQQKQQAQQLYSQYLNTIFPNSKVKDIVYHGSNQKINQFEVRKEPLIHFGNKNAALQRGDILNQVILNIKDLQTIKDGMWFLGTDEGGLLKELLDRNILTVEEVKSINKVKNDAIQQSPYFHENYRMAIPDGEKAGNKKLQEILGNKDIGFEYINFSEDKGSISYAVPSQEQIHILGNKQDIEGFKEFVGKKEDNTPILFSLNNNKTPEQQLEEFNKNESTTKYDEKILKAANNTKSSKPIDRDNYRNLIFKLRQKYPDLIFTMKSVLNPYSGYYEGILVAQIDSKVKNEKFQLGNNLLPSITEVNNSMISLLNKLGIKLEFSKNGKLTLPNGVEVDGVAFADIFNRVVQVVEGKMDGTTLPEEAAHIFTLLMKADDNLKQAMIKNVVKLQIYQDVKNDPKYQAQYGNNEDLYIIEAIGKVIAATMLNQPVLEAKSNKKALWVNIWFNNLISKLKQLFKINNTNDELQQILKPFIEVKDMMLDENIQNLLSLDEFKSLNTNNNKFQLFQLDNGNVSPEEYKNTVIDKIVNRFKINGNVAIDTSNNKEYSYEPTNSVSFKDVKSSNLGGQTHFKNFRNDLIESLKEIRSGITSDALPENKRKIISEYANQVNNEINKLYDPENQKDINVLFNVPYLDNKSNTVKTADLLIVLPDGTVDIKLFESINTSKKNGEYNVNWKTYSNFKDTIDSIKSYLTKIGIVKSVSIKIQPVLVKTQLFKNVKRFNTEGIGDPIAVFDVDGDIYKKFPNNIFTKNNARITSNEYTLGVAEPNAVNVTTISDYIEVSPVKVTESSPELDLFTTRSGLSNIDNININIVNFIKVLEDRLLKLEKSKLDWKTKAEAKSKILLTISQLLNRENYLYLTTSLLSHLEDFRTKLDESDLSISDLENGLEFITNVRNLRQNKVIDRDIINDLLKNNEIDEGTATTIIQNLNALIGLSDELLFTINEKIKINNIKLGNAENVNLNSNGNLLENINELPAEQRNEVIRASNLDSILGRIESNLLKFRQLASKNKWLKTALSIFDKQNQKIENEVLDFQKQLLKFKDKLGDRILSLINKDTDNLITKTKKEYWELKRNAIEKNNWRWIAENHNIKEGAKEEYDEALENYIKTLDNNLALSNIERESFLLRFKNQNDIWSDVHKKQALLSYGFKYLEIKNDWLSDEYKNLPSDLKEFYDFYHKTMVNLSYVLDARDKFNGNFIPNISKTLLESIFNGNSLNMESFIGSLKFTGESIGHLNPTTNKIEYTIPKYFINELTDVNGNPLTGQTKSHDLYKSLSAFYAMAMNYKYKSEVEDDMASLLHGIQNEPVLDKINGQYKVIDDNTDNTEVLRDFVNWALYSIDNKSKDSKFLGTNLSANKTIKQFKKTITTTSLTLNFLSIVANKVGNEVNLFMEAAGGRMFNTKDALWARTKLKHVFDNPEVVGFLYKSGILDTKENIKNNNKSLSLSKIINGYDKVNGLFIQHFLEKDFTNRVALILAKNYTIDENKKIVKITDEKNQKNLLELGKIDGDLYTLDVSDEELLKFRNKVSYYNEKLTGFSDREDKMRIQLYSLGDLLTTFRGWIPKMYEARFTKGYYNDEADAWVQGRYLTFYRDLVDSKGKSMLNNLMYTLPFSNTLFKENFENSVRARAEKAFYKEMETNPNILLDTKEEYIETFIANTKMNLMELRIMLAITLFIAMLGGFDDDKKKKNKGAITILKRSFSELVFFNPAFLQTGALSIIKSPIVGTNFVTNNLSLLGNLMYLPFADDKEKVGIKIGKEIIKDIPAASGMYGNIENFKDAIN